MKSISNVSALQIFQSFRLFILFIISVILAKSNFTKIEIGQYETFVFFAGAATFFWLNAFIKSFLASYKRINNKTNEIFNFYLLILLFSLIAFIAIKIIFKQHFFYFENPEKLSLYILLLGTASINEYVLLALKKNNELVLYGIISNLLLLILVIYFVLSGYNLTSIIDALLIVVFLKNIYSLILISRFSRFSVSFYFLKKNIKLGYPLIISFLFSGSAQYIDGFIIKTKFNNDVFAIFRYGAKEFPLLILLSDAMSSVFVNDFANYKRKIVLTKLKNKSLKLVNWLFPISILLLITSNYLYEIVFSINFVESSVIFDIYILLIISRLIFSQTIVLGLKDSKTIMKASAIELFINILLSLLFVNLWGITGVAYATVISFYIEKLYLLFIVKNKFSILPSEYLAFKPYIIYSVILLSLFIIKYTFII